MQLVWICLGGAVGSGARHLVSVWTLRAFGAGFPYGTLIVNLVGSFLLALLMQIGLGTELLRPTLRLALTTGVLGGFTTWSAFSYESLRLYQEGATWLAVGYVSLTLAGGLLGCALGLAIGRWLAGA